VLIRRNSPKVKRVEVVRKEKVVVVLTRGEEEVYVVSVWRDIYQKAVADPESLGSRISVQFHESPIG
jgi:hypothetical protein